MAPVLHEPALVGVEAGAVTVTVLVGVGVGATVFDVVVGGEPQRLAFSGLGVATARRTRARTGRTEMRENMFAFGLSRRRELLVG